MNNSEESIKVKEFEFNKLAAKNHVRGVSEASGSSFLSGIKILANDRREAMFAIYAFCREIDDIADGPLSVDEKRLLLSDWRQEIEDTYAGNPTNLTGLALSTAIKSYGLQMQDFHDLIDGMEMDADETATHGPSMEILETYCDRVASAVGRLSVRVFGDTSKSAQKVAFSLGRALQLTNILRDIHEDAERGRLYLPANFLNEFGIETRKPKKVILHKAIPYVCEALAEVALEHYRDAASAMTSCSRRNMRPALIMMLVYQRVLEGLMNRGWNDLNKPVKVSKPVKLWILLRHGFF
tara:strand:+ start:74 stop:961 length:888 start_codon:yes stop_codon:yes gene_type:complete